LLQLHGRDLRDAPFEARKAMRANLLRSCCRAVDARTSALVQRGLAARSRL
jgi:hypothetical protein